MVKIKSGKYPENKQAFLIFQEYAWRYYMGFFMALMLILLYQLARQADILTPGVTGVFGVVFLSNVFAVIEMRKDLAEIGFHEGHFYLKNVYQANFNQNPDFFPLPYANAQIKGGQLSITYFDSIYTLDPNEWDNWDDLLYYFGFRWYQA